MFVAVASWREIDCIALGKDISIHEFYLVESDTKSFVSQMQAVKDQVEVEHAVPTGVWWSTTVGVSGQDDAVMIDKDPKLHKMCCKMHRQGMKGIQFRYYLFR